MLQRKCASGVVHEVLRSPGQPLDTATRAFMGPRFGHDFSKVSAFNSYELAGRLPSNNGNVIPVVPGGSNSHAGVQLAQLAIAQGTGAGGAAGTQGTGGGGSGGTRGTGAGGVVTPGTGAGGAAPPASHSVLYVSFQNVAPPGTPDNSRMFPGPAGTLSDNAGFTHAVLGGRMSLLWDSGTMQTGGLVPIFLRSVNIFYRLDPIEVFVSSQYRPGTCPYRVTQVHEFSHVNAFTSLFHAGRDTLLAQLAPLSIPTESAPRLVTPANSAAEQSTVENSLLSAIQTHRNNLKAQMDADRDAKDSPASYASTYAQCPAGDW